MIKWNKLNIQIVCHVKKESVIDYAPSGFSPGLNTGHALIVLETEGCFVAFGYFIAAWIDYVESSKYFHRVIMPIKGKYVSLYFYSSHKNLN